MADQNKAAEPAKTAPAATAETGGVPIRLLYDVWGEDDQRIPAGTEFMAPVDIAKKLIADGKAERNDPLPGENK